MIIDSRPKFPQPAAVRVSFTTPGETPSVPPSPTSTLVGSAPPPYHVSSPVQTRCSSASSPGEHSDVETAEEKHKRRRKWPKIFLRVAFGVWVVASAYVVLVQLRNLAGRVATLIPTLSSFGEPDLDDLGIEQQQLGVAVACSKWHHNSRERASFRTYLPEDTTKVFLHNLAGPLVSGSLHVWSGPPTLHRPQLRIEARSKHKKLIKALHTGDVCVMRGDKPRNYGLVISDTYAEEEIYYTINLVVPGRSTDLQLKTMLPRFRQVIGMSGSSPLRLSTVSLGGPVTELIMNSAEVARLHIDTVDSFCGSLTVTESLSIKSETDSIEANVTLLFKGQPLRVSLETDHEPIDAIIRVKDVDSNDHPTFGSRPIPLNITVTTGHAPIALGVVYNSSNVVLGVNATTRLAPLYVQVPLSYEGTFDFSAFSSEAEILSSPSDMSKDPLNRARTRLVKVHSSNSNETTTAIGNIEWVYDDDVREVEAVSEHSLSFRGSHIQATTLLAKAVLDLRDSALLFSTTSSWGEGCLV